MTDVIARDLMIPVKDYAVVSTEASLYDAIVALERCQKEHCKPSKNHQTVLVKDGSGDIVGQVSQWDAIRALDAVQDDSEAQDSVSKFGLNPELVRSMMVSHRVWNRSLEDTCTRAGARKVHEFMSTPEKNTFVDEEAPLAEILYRMVKGEQLSLLVTSKEEVVGVLRVIDVMALVCRLVKGKAPDDCGCEAPAGNGEGQGD